MTETSANLRVFQAATGNVGSEMIKRIQRHPGLDLVGLHCYSPDKVGRDAGEIVGIDSVGVTASDSVDAILAAKPDALTFHGIDPDIDMVVRVLESGINILTTSDWITGEHFTQKLGRNVRQEIQDACMRGGASFYGTGMNPGLLQVLAAASTCDVAEIEHLSCTESVDVSWYASPITWERTGFGRPADDPEVEKLLRETTAVLAEGVQLLAETTHLALDSIRFECEVGACNHDIDLGWYHLPQGSVGACRMKYVGSRAGIDRIEVALEWAMTPETTPPIEVKGCYITSIKGSPYVYSEHWILPEPGADIEDLATVTSMGMTATGMPVLNAVPAVVAAPPGVLSSADLPLSAFAGRFVEDK